MVPAEPTTQDKLAPSCHLRPEALALDSSEGNTLQCPVHIHQQLGLTLFYSLNVFFSKCWMHLFH